MKIGMTCSSDDSQTSRSMDGHVGCDAISATASWIGRGNVSFEVIKIRNITSSCRGTRTSSNWAHRMASVARPWHRLLAARRVLQELVLRSDSVDSVFHPLKLQR